MSSDFDPETAARVDREMLARALRSKNPLASVEQYFRLRVAALELDVIAARVGRAITMSHCEKYRRVLASPVEELIPSINRQTLIFSCSRRNETAGSAIASVVAQAHVALAKELADRGGK